MSKVKNTNKNYWDDTKLNLHFKSKGDFSLDNVGAKKYKKKATVSGSYVYDLQKDLIKIGYIDGKADGYFGSKSKRAVLRFQRHAKRMYRMKKGKGNSTAANDVKSITFKQKSDGVVNHITAQEIRLWISTKWVLPLGRFKKTAITGGALRKDAATAWRNAAGKIRTLGGTIAPLPKYGDTTRSITQDKKTGGNSLYSLHYSGRAVDLTQHVANYGSSQKYFLIQEPKGGKMYFRIYCKTTLQNGKQGKKFTKPKKYYDISSKKDRNFRTGYYLDITKILESYGFARIPAKSGWKAIIWKRAEWWHYYWPKKIQATFQDEMELFGIPEKKLRKQYWKTDKRLDHKPG